VRDFPLDTQVQVNGIGGGEVLHADCSSLVDFDITNREVAIVRVPALAQQVGAHARQDRHQVRASK